MTTSNTRVGLVWKSHKTGELKPCRICGKGAFLRDQNGVPCHKVCAEAELARTSLSYAGRAAA